MGGGPAGAATAAFLARAGMAVRLLDRARFPRDKPCAEYLSPQASRLLDELGVLERVEAAAPARLGGMRVHAPDGTSFTGEFIASHGFRGFRDHGLALRRSVLDAILLDAARSAGAEVLEEVTVTGVERNDGRATGVQVTHGGTQRTLRAPLIVGADGLRTVVGRRLGLVRRGRRPSRMAIVMHYVGVTDVGAVGEMHVFADGYVGIASVGHGIANVAIVIPTALGHAVRGDPEAFADAWLAARPALAPRFKTSHRLEKPVATGPFNQRAAHAWTRGAVLVGDAADFFDPFTGEGIYAALRGAELLTPYAFEAARASTQKHDVALAAYDRCRREEFRGKWAVERIVGSTVGMPWLFNRAAAALSRRRDMSDLLVGVTGDFVPAHRILRPGYLLPLLYGLVRVTTARRATVALSSSPEVPARVRP